MTSESNHLHSTNHSTRVPGVSALVERVGKSFVAAWLLDNQQRVESYLATIPEDLQVEAHDVLIRLEVYMRASTGEELDPKEFYERFPDYEVEVEHAFRNDSRESELPDTKTGGADLDSSSFQVTQTLDVVPGKIGRYEIQKVLGTGGFGVVCLARDTQLERLVALKFARTSLFRSQKEMDDLIREAQTAAKLEYPGIVAVHDVLLEDEFVAIVQQLVTGGDLSDELATGLPTFARTAELMVTVCTAIAFAHSKGFVHRDLKPANILIDEEGNPHITDFGLAIHESFQRRRRGDQSGTPRFMSPELVRGETHRIDGRSDIWSIGIMLYQMLTGQRPFSGETRAELFDEIKNREPKPLRQIRSDVPMELERICLRCLSKPVSERYATANDLAEELKLWLQDMKRQADDDTISDRFTEVIPKGLRSFEAADAEYFFKLLPGPRGRNGMPESIRSWKDRIEHRGEDTLQIGLLYGPSGCGKSSFVKAGLIPFLAPFVKAIRIEATAADTEVRLIKALRARYPKIPTELSLPELFHSLREGLWRSNRERVLVVIDQFEQWLHNRSSYPHTELVEALRHCDGEHLQCLLMVRDDFWLATSRFLKALEVDLVEGKNAGLVDLFDKPHAEKVLVRYGRGYGRLDQEVSKQQTDFVQMAVDELAEDDRVICVRLSLFAEMFRDKPWTPEVLRKAGGISGVGVAFLEDTFSSKNARPEYSLHEQAARSVLAALLPDSSVEIRGNMRSRQDLLHLSGYSTRPNSFADLLRILDNELRLITPTDPEGIGSDVNPAAGGTREFYQLTHDYLVAPLRIWLYRKQRETIRGRARLRLDERHATWSRTRENRFLPPASEYVNVRTMTKPASWSRGEAEMIGRADRYYGVRFLGLVAILVAVGFGARQWYGNMHANNLIKRLVEAKTVDTPPIIAEIEPWRSWVTPRLQRKDVSGDSRKQLHVDLALSHLPENRGQLWNRLVTHSRPAEVPLIASSVAPDQRELDQLWNVLKQPPKVSTDLDRMRAAAALAHWLPDDSLWQTYSGNVASSLLNQDAYTVSQWTEVMRPVGEPLSRALIDHVAGWQYGASSKQIDPEVAIRLISSYIVDSPGIVEHIELLIRENEYFSKFDEPETDLDLFDAMSQRQANVATILVALGELSAVVPLLDSTTHERTRTLLIEQFQQFGVKPETISSAIQGETGPDVRAALWLALGSYVKLPVDESDGWLVSAKDEFVSHPDARVHTAAEWLIRKMERGDWVDQQVTATTSTEYPPNQTWRTTNGLTLLRIQRPGKFEMSYERPVTIDYDFEVSAMEINGEQLLQFEPRFDYLFSGKQETKRPATNIQWSVAAEYCNWLSEQAGIPGEEWCYEPVAEFDFLLFTPQLPYKISVPTFAKAKANELYGDQSRPFVRTALKLASDYRNRSGFRLPLESEWDWLAYPACNKTRLNKRFQNILDNYEWHGGNNQGDFETRIGGIKKPGRFGTFDLLGNVFEVCSDSYASLDPKSTSHIQLTKGEAYLDPVALREWKRRLAVAGSFDLELSMSEALKLNKGVTVIRRGFDDQRNNIPSTNSYKYTGFRVVRILNGKNE